MADICGHDLHSIMWEAVRRVEQVGLHVVAFISDGAQPNRKFYRDHHHASTAKNGITYKTPNLYLLHI